MGGPAGCLQFFTGATGTVNTFNWVAVATSKCLKSILPQYEIRFNPKRPGGGAAAAHRSGDRLTFLIESSFQHPNFMTFPVKLCFRW